MDELAKHGNNIAVSIENMDILFSYYNGNVNTIYHITYHRSIINNNSNMLNTLFFLLYERTSSSSCCRLATRDDN